MARLPMVTRTIMTTKVNVLCMNIVSAEAQNEEVTLPRTYSDEKKLLKAVQSVVNTDELKAVSIVDVETIETLYGMSEQDFINGAKILDKDTRKAIEE